MIVQNTQSETDEEIEIHKSFDNHYDTCIEENSNHSVAEVEEQTNDTSGYNFQINRAIKKCKTQTRQEQTGILFIL